MNRAVILAGLLGCSLLLAGCVGNEQVVRDCCYTGSSTAARLSGLPLTLEDGGTVPVASALEGFHPQPGFGGARYPLRKVDLRFVTQADVKDVFRSYDANGNNALETPEITVLYVREAALGMGVPVAYLGDSQPVGALDTAPADIMGLVAWVRANRQRMNRRGQLVFDEMETQGQLIRVINSGGPDPRKIRP